MNHLFKKFAVVLLLCGIFSACKKDNDEKSDFDINNPAGYVILANTGASTIVHEFRGDGKVNYITLHIPDEFPYTVTGNKITLPGANTYFTIDGNNVKLYRNDVLQTGTVRLVKKPETSQLQGKTFKGVYKRSDGTVLHPQFFYSFHPNSNKVDAGFVVGTAVRTETYTSLSNVASRTEHYINPEYYEMLVLIDGKLYASYSDNTGTSYAVLDPL